VKVEKDGMARIRESMSRIFTKAGIGNMDANVLSELLIWDKYMSVCDIANNLNYSISGITGSLHRLMRMHLIVRKKNGKKYLYRSESDILSVFLRLVEEVYNHDLPRVQCVVKEEMPNLDGEEEKVVKELDVKLSKAAAYLGSLIEILDEYSKKEVS
jgi:predicted transcriptional regulator